MRSRSCLISHRFSSLCFPIFLSLACFAEERKLVLSGDTDLPEAPASIPTHPSRTREVCVRPPNNPRNEGAMDAEAQTIPRTLILTRKRYSQVHLYPFQRAAS